MRFLSSRSLSILLIVLAFTASSGMIGYSMGLQVNPQVYQRNLTMEQCYNGHGYYYAGLCYMGELKVTKFDGRAHPFFYNNVNNQHDPMNGQCIANCVIIGQPEFTYNLLTQLGKNVVKTNLGTASNQTTELVIILGNSSFASASQYTVYCCGLTGSNNTAYTGSGNTGLGAGQGTYTGYASTGTGTWTVTQTWTLAVSATATINGAALANHCCGSSTARGATYNTSPNPTNNVFAEATFAAVTLNTGDSLQVQWSITVS